MEPRIVAGYDGSTRSRVAAHWAAREAARRERPLHVVSVTRDVTAPSGADAASLDTDPASLVAELCVEHPQLAIKAVHFTGTPAETFTALTASDAELLVLGTRGAGGWAGLPVGSVALSVAEQALVPVVLVPSGPLCRVTGAGLHAVALAVDPHDPAEAAADFAFDMARRRRHRLRAVHGWFPPSREDGRSEWLYERAQCLADAMRPWRHKYPEVRVDEDIVLGAVAPALAQVCERADLLVVGRSRTRLGSVVREVVARARGPVAVVPS
ncbi:universal stress protein [Streptomyces sp. TRM66268-LWL]|uniref:Universal stress protein n=1 Tax=Streptomyces polyasparticus TaxID=2767826 RepID=A0ABR7SRV6_9ACTN|nr:universal stress protein [Streptomyces polyasparticus]MBC9717385.1 universal stress protein [Streptomyces polyasparticus]